MTFNELYNYCDALVSEDFEGLPKRYNFTEDEWLYVRNIQKW